MEQQSLHGLSLEDLLKLMIENVTEILEMQNGGISVDAIRTKNDFVQLLHKVITQKLLEKSTN